MLDVDTMSGRKRIAGEQGGKAQKFAITSYYNKVNQGTAEKPIVIEDSPPAKGTTQPQHAQQTAQTDGQVRLSGGNVAEEAPQVPLPRTSSLIAGWQETSRQPSTSLANALRAPSSQFNAPTQSQALPSKTHVSDSFANGLPMGTQRTHVSATVYQVGQGASQAADGAVEGPSLSDEQVHALVHALHASCMGVRPCSPKVCAASAP